MINSVAIERIGFWAPGFANFESWKSGVSDTSVEQPNCSLVAGRAKRGTSRITRMLGEVAIQAAEGGSLSETPIIFASAWGEIETMIDLLNQIVDGAEGLSPLRFKNSVHNASSGLVSIAAGNRAFSTAIAAGRKTFECGLLEALASLADHDEVILAVGDDCLPEPLDRYSDYESLALALRLSTTPSQTALCVVTNLRRASEPPAETKNHNPTADGLPLLNAIAKRAESAQVGNWVMDLSFSEST